MNLSLHIWPQNIVILLILIQTNSYQVAQKVVRNISTISIINKTTIFISKQKTGFDLLELTQNEIFDALVFLQQ